MTTQTHRLNRVGARWLLGLGMILTGLFLMVGSTTGSTRLLGLWFLFGLGLILVLWGIIAHEPGPVVPGALLTGISTGTLITQEIIGLDSVETAGIHALSVALGFVLITLVTLLFSNTTLWWPLIPGGLLLLGGANLLLRDVALAFVGDFWPVALIAGGIYLFWQSAT